MARKPRIWYPGATYHIMCRGNHRQEVFRDDQDRCFYLGQLLQAKEEYHCNILAYCLMTNHIHLQVETGDQEIWRFMKQINMRYAIFFNRKYNLVGHLFQGRYRGDLIKTVAKNLSTSRYIHLNPVEAKMVDNPADYPWSSYRDYIGMRSSVLVTPGKILTYFPGQSRKQYREYVEHPGD